MKALLRQYSHHVRSASVRRPSGVPAGSEATAEKQPSFPTPRFGTTRAEAKTVSNCTQSPTVSGTKLISAVYPASFLFIVGAVGCSDGSRPDAGPGDTGSADHTELDAGPEPDSG